MHVSLRRYLPFLKSTLSPLRVLFKCTSLLGLEANTLVPLAGLEPAMLSLLILSQAAIPFAYKGILARIKRIELFPFEVLET